MHAVSRYAALVPLMVLAMNAEAQTTQRQYQLHKGNDGTPALKLVDAPVRQPGDHEVLVKVHAVSLNRRDMYMRMGKYPGPVAANLVPLSDGAGEVVAAGSKVTRLKKGDRVASIFFQTWLSGHPKPQDMGSALGGAINGMLSQFVTLSEDGWVKIPKHLSYEEAATLPCAGVTAWNALVTRGRAKPGDYVLLQGTGGVSIMGLQLAVAMGAKPVITSSSDDKLARARKMGAVATINYKTTPDWEKAVLEATGGGAQQALEVGGKQTLGKTLASLAPGGHVALIGGLSEFGGDIPSYALLGRNATASGIYVGSRENFEAMNEFITKHQLKPAIDKVFEYENAAAAFDYMDSGSLFGKVVIRL
ncbi:MAG TPA: NAD(P)-dependent alcohol dehydrogenase [Steroidobacteraceae bacterium]|nr:NAD(P)-dependent alcohol dehydrogenase [Steroidobacteraceae bacterium]